MKAVIADDEPLARSLLRTLLDDAGDVEVVGEARNGVEATALAEQLRPDVVFLDINMPGGEGIGAAHELSKRQFAELVFVTAHELHAVDAFELGAIDYILKPLRRPRLAKALDRVRARIREKGEKDATVRNRRRTDQTERVFWVQAGHGTVRLPLSDIIWIEAARDHVYFHTAGKSYMHRITMKKLEAELHGTDLVRIQRSTFVRLDKVKSIVRKKKLVILELEESTRLPLGSTYQARTLAALADR